MISSRLVLNAECLCSQAERKVSQAWTNEVSSSGWRSDLAGWAACKHLTDTIRDTKFSS